MNVTTARAFHRPEGERSIRRLSWLLWESRVPSGGLLWAALLVSLVVGLPVLYLAVRAGQGSLDTWAWLLSDRLPGLMGRSLLLVAGTTLLASAISLPVAWLIQRTDLPGRSQLGWLMALPLVFPPYVGAFAYMTLFGQKISSLPGAVIILSLFTYPYIYLLVSSALRSSSQSLEEAARCAGLSPTALFWRVTLPMLRPALTAGALLVALYALSDFGAVAMLRVETFTSAIYLQLRGRFDRSAAAALSLVLVLLTMLLLWAEQHIQRQGARYYQAGNGWRPVRTVPLGKWKWPALLFAWSVLLFGVGMPAGMLAYWSVQGVEAGRFRLDLLGYAVTSLLSASSAALLATALALPIAVLAARHPGPISRFIFRSAYTGYALPGVVVALATIFFFHRYLYPLYGTAWAMLAAYVIRFMPQALGAAHSGLAALPPSLEEAGRSLGYATPGVFRRITLPLIGPSLVTGAAMVFLNTLKELPATLLLRPAGLDTLAVRVWLDADEGFFAKAAPSALLLVLMATVPLALLLRRIFRGEARLS